MSILEISQPAMPSTQTLSLKRNMEKTHKSKEGKKRKREQGDESGQHRYKKHRKHNKKGKPTSRRDDGAEDENAGSPFHIQTASLYLPLAPISQRKPLEGICAEHLSLLILTYYPPLGGVILSFSNARMSEQPFQNDGSETLLQCIDEFAVSWAWVTADFLIFKPARGGELEGYVNLQNEGHLGIVCWNLFNASIERKRLPADWNWIGVESEKASTSSKLLGVKGQYADDGIGYYVDGDGNKVEGSVKFRVKNFESSHDRERGFLSIEGTMLGKVTEKELFENEAIARKSSINGLERRLGGSRALGATSLGVQVEPSADGIHHDGRGTKHRRTY